MKCPESIRKEMDLWRMGAIGLPRSYVLFHTQVSEMDMRRQDWTVLEDKGMVSDGWGDGMKVRELVVAVANGEPGEWSLETVRWHESGAWFRRGAGWSRFREMTPKTAEKVDFYVNNKINVDNYAAFDYK